MFDGAQEGDHTGKVCICHSYSTEMPPPLFFFLDTVFPQYPQEIGLKPAHPVHDKIHRRSSSLCGCGTRKGRVQSNCTNFPCKISSEKAFPNQKQF